MNYSIASAGSRIELEHQVRELINDGWAPQGGVAVSCDSSGSTSRFFQAMTYTPPIRVAVDVTSLQAGDELVRDGGGA